MYSAKQFGFEWLTNIWDGENCNPFHRRCEAIRKKLCEHGHKARVSRHTAFDVKYYVIEQWDDKTLFNVRDIASALEIPKEWCSLVNYMDGIGTYWVKEDELHEKYLDCNGDLVFNESFDFLEASPKEIKWKLGGGQVQVVDYKDIVLIKNYCAYNKAMARLLNIPLDSIVDVSDSSMDISHIILKDKVKE